MMVVAVVMILMVISLVMMLEMVFMMMVQATTSAVNTSLKNYWRAFKLHRIYSNPLNMSNGGDFSRGQFRKGFIQVQKEEEKFAVVCSRRPQNVA